MGKPNKNGNNGSNKGGSIKGPQCAAQATIERAKARTAERRANTDREALKASGEFYTAKNDGRETDVLAIEKGHIGHYAVPGGDKPSVHLRVSDIGSENKPFKVVFYEGAHEGSGLPGDLSHETYLPCFVLKQDEFTSRLSGLWAETQDRLFQFLTGQIDKVRKDLVEKEKTGLIDDMFTKSNKDLRDMKNKKIGLYGVRTADGTVIFQVFVAKHVSVSVLKSTIPGMPASRAFVPLHLLESEKIVQVTDEETFGRQVAIHRLLHQLLQSIPVEEVLPQKSVATSVATTSVQKTQIEPPIDLKKIMKGATGTTVFAEGERSAIVKVADKQTNRGLLRQFEVVAMTGFNESSVLSFEVGTMVTAQNLIAGAVEKSEIAGLSPKTAGAKLALINFITQVVKATRFCKKPSEAILPKAPALKVA